ncbi:hypothetical protein HERIO_1364 [Hepatospora eriocheir]|uniref:Uncharacterized protein n=1 Tax=Hepatospora eriocheir TaxID=1081669 RepID=A0A1X0QAD8_9MICR|nr:hypothetical protein HERIO_1364 [Hepatospora eriocheir]
MIIQSIVSYITDISAGRRGGLEECFRLDEHESEERCEEYIPDVIQESIVNLKLSLSVAQNLIRRRKKGEKIVIAL